MKYSSIVILFIVCTRLPADTLSLEEAVEIGLDNNFSIRISRVSSDKNYRNKKLKTGALLPTVRVNGGVAVSRTDYATPPPTATSGATGELQAGAIINWTLFDGFQMFYTGRQIDQQIALGELSTRYEIESAVAAIMTAYYQLISQRSLLAAARQQLALSRSQQQLIDAQYKYGRIGKRELLTQQVIVNSDSSLVLSRILEERSALHALNITLGRTPDIPVTVTTEAGIRYPENDAAWWFNETMRHNTGLKITTVKKHITLSQHAIARASLWPVLSANGTATSVVTDPSSYVRTRGEINLSIPLFSGFNKITAVEKAALDTLSATLSLQKQTLELQSIVYEQWERLRISCEQITFERQAIDRAKQSLDLSREQFKLGRISDIQLREAQLSLINAQVRFQSALFQNNVVALQLQQLAGKLIFKNTQ